MWDADKHDSVMVMPWYGPSKTEADLDVELRLEVFDAVPGEDDRPIGAALVGPIREHVENAFSAPTLDLFDRDGNPAGKLNVEVRCEFMMLPETKLVKSSPLPQQLYPAAPRPNDLNIPRGYALGDSVATVAASGIPPLSQGGIRLLGRGGRE